ncbi:hypothetical protein [Microvirga flavescens]|uniref:hypothetical protein n=1 Tax=Microvirga flavescens TaxID=2249811 RepID=UPI001300739B|nr:hypothetical protein [Microvirga flavescens]
MNFVSALFLTGQLILPAADGPPRLDVQQSCKSAMKLDPQTGSVDACMKDENDALAELKRLWTTFPAGDRARCTTETSTGGAPSYVELITCLQIAQDARQAPKN